MKLSLAASVLTLALVAQCAASAEHSNTAPVAAMVDRSSPATPTLETLPLRTSVSQYGITWTFEHPSRVGQFVNGDAYVVGSVTVTAISPRPLWGKEIAETIDRDQVREGSYAGKQARNGSELNPKAKTGTGGFDSRIPSGRYQPDLFAHLPIRMAPGDSLVSTISRDNQEITRFGGQHVDPLRVAAVLTCVAAPQPSDAFRPSYCDTTNSPQLLARNLKRGLLPSLKRVPGAPRSLDAYVKAFEKPWLDTVDFGFAAPMENLPHYGQYVAQVVGEAGLVLSMDYPLLQKEPLLINFVQVGIDLWGVARTGGSWPAHGGLNSGRKWPIVFAGMMLDQEAMQYPSRQISQLRFAEDEQTAFCPYTYNGRTFAQGWTGARAIFTGHSIPGSGGDRGRWEKGWGPLELFPPAEWPLRGQTDLPASESYRRANTSGAWVGEALAVRLMHAEKIWNHDAFFAYVDRWMTEDDKPFLPAIKAAGFQDMTQIPDGRFIRQGHVWGPKLVTEMWKTYRNHLPPAADGHKDLPAEQTWK